MEEVFTIMRRLVQTLSRYYGYAFTDNWQLRLCRFSALLL